MLKFTDLLLGGTLLVISANVNAAQINSEEYQRLWEIAFSEKAVRVTLLLGDSKPLNSSPQQIKSQIERFQRQFEMIKNELGSHAYYGGQWFNGSGQAGLYVTREGLEILRRSSNFPSFRSSSTDKTRPIAQDLDGGLTAIQQQVHALGMVRAEVVLNTESARYRLEKDGTTTVIQSPELRKEVGDILFKISQLPINSIELTKSISAAMTSSAIVELTIDKKALVALQENPYVRAIRPINFIDSRPANYTFGPADGASEVEVIITLRGGKLFSPSLYWDSPAGRSQSLANRSAFEEILSQAGISAPPRDAARENSGSLFIKISREQFERLKNNADARLLEVMGNRLVHGLALESSMPLMNMPYAWSVGANGTNQTIVVVDDGVLKTHGMLSISGVSRVVAEGCYGTDQSPYASICPQKNSFGDSPPNTPDAGRPNPDIIGCQIYVPFRYHCGHGTAMATIAAGHYSATVGGGVLQGVAPMAKIHAINVISYWRSGNKYGAFLTDTTKALTDLVNANGGIVTPGTTAPVLPMVVNLSLAGGTNYTSEALCDYDNSNVFKNQVKALRDRGIPTFAATGNQNAGAYPHPACSQYTIKVSAAPNDGIGLTRASYANLVPPGAFSQKTFIAIGGENSTGVFAGGRLSDDNVVGSYGTSQATAHMSGFAASYKSQYPNATVDDLVEWLSTAGSIPMFVSIAGVLHEYRRIRY